MADIKVRVGQQNATKVISSLAGAATLSLSELSDVNVVNPQNGMVLVYNALTKKFDATLESVSYTHLTLPTICSV